MLHYNPNDASAITHAWCFKHELFNRQECKKIVSYCGGLQKLEAEISMPDGETVNKQIRISDISWVEYIDDSKWFYDRLAWAIDELNQTFYKFDLTGFNNLQFTEYKSNKLSKYDWHMDMFLGKNVEPLTRKLSATLLLNDNFDGGQFEFFDFDHDQPKMSAGTLIVFPSFMVHRIKPITKGTRNSLVCWCLGQKFK
jgi:PKHD-type hydroxylase